MSRRATWPAAKRLHRVAAGETRTEPAVVYAMNKTGRIVAEQNMWFLTDFDLQEWNDAVDEYRQMIGSRNAQ
jgi:hypothetical protein